MERVEERVAAEVAVLWERYRERIMDRLESLDAAAEAALRGRLGSELRRRACTDAHKLAGSLGTFGLGEASSLAEEAESVLQREAPLGEAEAITLSRMVGSLCRALKGGPRGEGNEAHLAAGRGRTLIGNASHGSIRMGF